MRSWEEQMAAAEAEVRGAKEIGASTPTLLSECETKLERVINALEVLDDSPMRQVQRVANELAQVLNEVQYTVRIVRERRK